MARVFFGNSGSDANDTQVKLVWYYNNVLGRPEKKKIISRVPRLPRRHRADRRPDRAGNLHDGFDLPLPMIRHTRAPHRLWDAEPGETDEEFARRSRPSSKR